MTGALTALPPAAVLFALAVAVRVLPRRAGHATAALGVLGTAGWVLLAPAGAHLPVVLIGFDAVLFLVDPFSRVLGVAFGLIGAAAVAYAYAVGADRRQTALALAYLGAGMGAAVAGDWLTLVVYWELMAVAATVLVWYRANDWRPGFRYAVYHELGGLALMAGVLLHFDAAGTFVFGSGIAQGLPAVLVALGIGLNAGFLGLHVWVVDTYPRTHVAVSVVLAAVTTKVGAFAIVRAFPDGHLALAYMGGAMVIVGVTMAILQTDMRRLLSYHIISQVGYIVAGFGAGAALASAGAMAHIFNHILYKGLLFMVAGIIIHRTGKTRLKELGGLGRELPLTAMVFVVAALSIAGIPGFNGFVSKGMILDGVEKGGLEPLWWLLLVGGVGTVVSFAKFGYSAFLHGEAERSYGDLTRVELGTLGGVAALCILFGLVPSVLLDLLPAEGVVGAKPFAPKQFLKAGGVATAGLVAFMLARRWLGRVKPVADLEVLYHPWGRSLIERSGASAEAVERGINRVWGFSPRTTRRLLEQLDHRRDAFVTVPDPRRAIGTGLIAVVLTLVVLLALLLA